MSKNDTYRVPGHNFFNVAIVGPGFPQQHENKQETWINVLASHATLEQAQQWAKNVKDFPWAVYAIETGKDVIFPPEKYSDELADEIYKSDKIKKVKDNIQFERRMQRMKELKPGQTEDKQEHLLMIENITRWWKENKQLPQLSMTKDDRLEQKKYVSDPIEQNLAEWLAEQKENIDSLPYKNDLVTQEWWGKEDVRAPPKPQPKPSSVCNMLEFPVKQPGNNFFCMVYYGPENNEICERENVMMVRFRFACDTEDTAAKEIKIYRDHDLVRHNQIGCMYFWLQLPPTASDEDYSNPVLNNLFKGEKESAKAVKEFEDLQAREELEYQEKLLQEKMKKDMEASDEIEAEQDKLHQRYLDECKNEIRMEDL